MKREHPNVSDKLIEYKRTDSENPLNMINHVRYAENYLTERQVPLDT